MVEGEDEAEKGLRSIPSLAHALEEARARVTSRAQVEAPLRATDAEPLGEPTVSAARPRSGSLLNLARSSVGNAQHPADRTELARLAAEANAARRGLAGAGQKVSGEVRESMDEIRAMLDECLIAVRECREMVRALATRRDRNYF